MFNRCYWCKPPMDKMLAGVDKVFPTIGDTKECGDMAKRSYYDY